MKGILTTLEASEKYGISTRHLRYLLDKGHIKGRSARISTRSVVWLIDEKSLKKYPYGKVKPGRKPRK